MQAHALPLAAVSYSDTVVGHRQLESRIRRAKANGDLPGVGVPGCIVYGFLRDAIEVIGDKFFADRDRTIALDRTVCFEAALYADSKFLESGHEALLLEEHGKKSSRQLPR